MQLAIAASFRLRDRRLGLFFGDVRPIWVDDDVGLDFDRTFAWACVRVRYLLAESIFTRAACFNSDN